MSEDKTFYIELLWREWELRQQHYWRTMNRFAFAIITLNVAPYFRVGEVAVLEQVGLAVIWLAILLSLAASWLLNAEYNRLWAARAGMDQHIPIHYRPKQFPIETRRDKFFWTSIGKVTTGCFLLGFTTVSIANALYFFLRC